jgi:uncharacterized protein
MSAQTNIDAIKDIYQAFGTGDVQGIINRCTDDVDWAADAAGKSAPWWGERKGKEALRGFFSGIADAVDVTEFTPLSFAANDDDEVMVFLRFAFRGNATGTEGAMHLHHYWRFRDGKVEYYRGSEDTQLTAATLGS